MYLMWHSEDSFTLQDGGTHNYGAIQSLEDLEHFTSLERLSINFQTNLEFLLFGILIVLSA